MKVKMFLDSFLRVPLLLGDKLQNEVLTLEEVESNSFHNSCTSPKISFLQATFNLMNTLSGVGILSVPYALASGGWLSLILLFMIALATFYTGLLIQRCMDAKSDITTYPEVGELAFGRNGKLIVSVFMYVELYLVATGFLILEGDNLNNMFPNVEFELLGFMISGQAFFVIVVALVILPSVWLDNLSLLSYISASGVLGSAVIIGSVFWCGVFDGIGFQQKGTLINWKGISNSISLYAFCYCAHPVFPTLYTSMKNKRQFSNVLTFCFIICTFGYASMAVMGYAMFGSDIKSQITLNLPTGKISSLVAIYTTLVNPICKYALMTVPIVNAIKNRFPMNYNTKPLSMLISTTLLVSNIIVALAIPFFGSLMSLVGAFLSVTASIILPCVCYLKISGNYKRFGLETVIISGIILIGVVAAIVGTYVAIVEIVGQI
ncbi:amino acid transporter AVT1I-like isoform X1 [Cucurbita maxima]|uniref:Amino acid transporter AVT1I-like isoform X1 n=1 Tax=Cucurbita maxima TaxID=3661 RepID=A0A6J1KVC1_CUCMA|nr:amino acid transporter AVT1I-like isoform X1 [Cucurbita maxima]